MGVCERRKFLTSVHERRIFISKLEGVRERRNFLTSVHERRS